MAGSESGRSSDKLRTNGEVSQIRSRAVARGARPWGVVAGCGLRDRLRNGGVPRAGSRRADAGDGARPLRLGDHAPAHARGQGYLLPRPSCHSVRAFIFVRDRKHGRFTGSVCEGPVGTTYGRAAGPAYTRPYGDGKEATASSARRHRSGPDQSSTLVPRFARIASRQSRALSS